MLVRPIYDEDLAHACYLIGCQVNHEAIVIDPPRDIDRVLDVAKAHGFKIVAVAETHIHADFLSGARELASKTSARVYVSGLGGPDWQSKWVSQCESTLLADGDTIEVGGIVLVAIHTPGHTPEHVSYLVCDRASGAEEPMALVSGDFVFVGDLGRPDLLESALGVRESAVDGARVLAESAKRFLQLPDFVQVWPAHGAGSACGKSLGAVLQSTVGYERRFSPLLCDLVSSGEEVFVQNVLDAQPEPPLYYARMKGWNRDGVPSMRHLPTPRTLRAEEISRAFNEEITVIDLRPWSEFRAAHLPGSLWSTMGINLTLTIGSYAEPEDHLWIVCPEDQRERVIRNFVRIGLDMIDAWVDPSEIAACREFGVKFESIPEEDPSALRNLLAHTPAPHTVVLDVRRAAEHVRGSILGSINIAHTRLADQLDNIPDDRVLHVHCQGGVRSAMAAAFLKREGFDVRNVSGGFNGWLKSGGERVTVESCAIRS
ncbi:MAG: MBL fold metallo-hydrolase [Planctomycetota bacterium]|nr:MBL fold metallo-hydrolase [Planctomycetota bacterium]